MMPRATPEWIGKHDDQAVPPRVRLRIFERCDGRCGCCNRPIAPGEPWQLDHVLALVNGGEHRENNMRPLLAAHHKDKTRADVAQKSTSYKRRKRHYGVAKPKGRPIAGTKASGWKHRMDGTWERR